MKETWIRSLVQEDPTYHGSTKPLHHSYWACALEPGRRNYWSPHALDSPCSTEEATTMRSPCATTREEPLIFTTREKARVAMTNQHGQKEINNFKKKKKEKWKERRQYNETCNHSWGNSPGGEETRCPAEKPEKKELSCLSTLILCWSLLLSFVLVSLLFSQNYDYKHTYTQNIKLTILNLS